MGSTLAHKAYRCKDCIYTYEPAQGDASQGIEAGTSFEELPKDWVCPICKVGKKRFKPLR